MQLLGGDIALLRIEPERGHQPVTAAQQHFVAPALLVCPTEEHSFRIRLHRCGGKALGSRIALELAGDGVGGHGCGRRRSLQ